MTGTSRWPVITVIGVTQIFAWGSSYYLPAVLAGPIAKDTGWSLTAVVAGLSIGLLIAGLVSPLVGRLIASKGGQPILAGSALLIATGQIALAAANIFPVYVAAWVILGLGMGAGLYDPAFATLGRLYGRSARSAITSVTLFGGFASTICWPLTAYLEAHWGWRVTCLVYAALQLGGALPIYLLGLPRPGAAGIAESAVATEAAAGVSDASNDPGAMLFILIATVITLSSIISATLSVHLLAILQDRGISLADAVTFGMLVGPAQVVARSVEMAIARYHHAIWTKLVSTTSVALGIAALLGGSTVLPFALFLYGAGIGLESIARGTVPLAVYGQERYPLIIGRIAMPSLIAQALAPSAAALLLNVGGAGFVLWAFLGIAAINLLLVVCLFARLKHSLSAAPSDPR